MDHQQATELLQDRLQHYRKMVKKYEQKTEEYDAITDTIEKERNLGRYLILERRLIMCTAEVEWCVWAQSTIDRLNTN